MSKKKGFRTVVATIIVTLVVLAALSYATIKYIAPAYQLNQYKIYQVAVRVFPLIVGIFLITMSSILAGEREEDDEEVEGDEDKLPPNAYDDSLFDAPKDDPIAKANAFGDTSGEQSEETSETKEEEPFVSVFEVPSNDAGAKEEEPKELEEEVPTDESVSEEEPLNEETPEEETSEEETPETTATVVQPQPIAQQQTNEDANKPLIDAIMALSDKIDDFAAAVVYGTEDKEIEEEDDDEDEEGDEEYEYYDGEEEEDPIYEGLDRIEAQLEKLTKTISQLSETLVERLEVPAPQPAPQQEPQPAPQPQPQPIEEEPVPATANDNTNDNTGDILYRSYEGSEAKQKAMAEYDSAKEFGYDLTFALIDLPLAQVALSLGEDGDAMDTNGKTFATIPFADEEEAKTQLDKLGAPYEYRTYIAGSNTGFDELANGIIEE